MTNVVLNFVQNPSKTNAKQRALADFLGFVDQFLQLTNETPVTRANAFDAGRPVIFI